MKSIKYLKKKGKISKNLDKSRPRMISENIIKYSIYHEPKENEIEIKLSEGEKNNLKNYKMSAFGNQMSSIKKLIERKVVIGKTMIKINELRKKNKKLDDKIKLLVKKRSNLNRR